MQREREYSNFSSQEQSFDQQLTLSDMQEPKIRPSQIDLLLQKQYQEQEVKIYELYYRDQAIEFPLFVKCPKIQDQFTYWTGYCQECGNDHDNKFFKIIDKNNPNYILLSKQLDYRVIDCDQFAKKISENVASQVNVFLKNINFQNIESEIHAQQKAVDQKLDSLNQLVDETYLQCCGQEIYKRYVEKFDGQGRVLKSLCTKNGKLYPWYGYCSHCKENPPHTFYVSFSGSKTPEPLPSSIKLRLINYQGLKKALFSEITDRLWDLVQWKFYLSTIKYQNSRLGIQSRMDVLEKSITNFKEENQNLKQTLSTQEVEKDKLKNLLQQESEAKSALETKRADLVFKPDASTDIFYDITIDCESILKLTAGEGWSISVKSSEFETKKAANTVVVSFYGLYNKGKTFLASKLSGKKLPLGYSVSTVGLSAVYPQDLRTENSIVFLDTAGTETPICYQSADELVGKHIEELQKQNEESIVQKEQNDQDPEINKRNRRNIYEIKLKDRLLTEHLLQRFILSESNIIMIIVDQLTKEEQRLVQKIKNTYEQSEIIIVHNLSKLVTSDDVKKYIQIDIIESFEVKPQNRIFEEVGLQGLCYVEKRYDTQGQTLPDITHIAMAHENSDAGKIYNPFCYHYLKNRILAVTRAKVFDIVSNLAKMIKLHLPEIIELPAEKLTQLTVEYKDQKIVANLNTSSLKSISFDLLGDLKVFKGGLDPKYSIIMTDVELILEVEIAGQFTPTERDLKQAAESKQPSKIIACKESKSTMFEWHGFRRDAVDKMQYIVLRGMKKEIHLDPNVEKLLTNGREKGEFRLIIPINPGICVLRDGQPRFIVENGVAKLFYILQRCNDQIDDFF